MNITTTNYSNTYNGHDILVEIVDGKNKLKLWYSWDVVIAFELTWDGENQFCISQNVWTRENTEHVSGVIKSTARHLNEINSDAKIRLPRAEFEARLHAVLHQLYLGFFK